MRPGAEEVLREVAGRLEREIIPSVGSTYDAVTVQLAAFIISAVADQWDTAAAWRREENDSLRRLFVRAVEVTLDTTLRRDLSEAAAMPPSGLRISELDQENDRLRTLLTRLQAEVGAREDGPARVLDKEIWGELAIGAARRAYITQPV